MVFYIIGLFAVSIGLGYGLTVLTQKKMRVPQLPEGCRIRLLSEAGLYSVRVDSQSERTIWIDAPLSENSHVPLRVGSKIYLEIPFEGGVFKFRTEIQERDQENHLLRVQFPSDFVREERRSSERTFYPEGLVTKFNSESAVLMNISSGGACVISRSDAKAGDWVRLDTPEELGRFACVLETLPDVLDGRFASRIRVCFADPK